MSAILSADDLNDFISPGVACIKPVESLPKPNTLDSSSPYEVTTEDKLAPETHLPTAQISLTDCLACSGCVTSAEAVLVSLQSHAEVLSTLDSYRSVGPENLVPRESGIDDGFEGSDKRIFIASVSPQTRASIAAAYGVAEKEAGWMIEQLLAGDAGLRSGGRHGSGFTWVVDTNVAREACLVLGAEEVLESLSGLGSAEPKRPILTSSCPGWICYAEKTHPHILPHLSRLKSPQALLGTLLKTSLSTQLGISCDKIWHVAIMPCFDKKLEASREELTDATLKEPYQDRRGIRDVNCVITTKELLMLADSRGIRFSDLPRSPLSALDRIPFPDSALDDFLFSSHIATHSSLNHRQRPQAPEAGTSGGYLHHILSTFQSRNPGSSIQISRGRNADVAEYTVIDDATGSVLVRTARYYGFRNIQNLVRKLKPAKKSRLPGARTGGTSRRPGAAVASATAAVGIDYDYVEVMACPGGCTNGGGQIKADDSIALGGVEGVEGVNLSVKSGPQAQKDWLAKVDEAYFSGSESGGGEQRQTTAESKEGLVGEGREVVNGIDTKYVKSIVKHWTHSTGIPVEKLAYTTYRKVESDVGKGDFAGRVVELAGKIGSGW